MRNTKSLFLLLLLAFGCGTALAQSGYAPSKVVYDVSSPQVGELDLLIDRAALLQKLYGNDPFDASIVFVIHEGAIPHFARDVAGNAALLQRARDLSLGEIIEFRLCQASARMQGFDAGDFPDFIAIVPMADAEIVRLQQQGYAYLR